MAAGRPSFPRAVDALDLGCRTGRYFCALRACTLIGVDVAACSGKRGARCTRSDDIGRIALVHGDLLAQEFDAGQFDFMYSIIARRHVRAAPRSCRESRWLKARRPFRVLDRTPAPRRSGGRSRDAAAVAPLLPGGLASRRDRLLAGRCMPTRRVETLVAGALRGRSLERSIRSASVPVRRTQGGRVTVSPRSLIIGGLGFIGVNLTDRLIADGHAVTVVTPSRARHEARAADVEARGGRVVEGDLRDAAVMARAVRDQELVFNLAAESGAVHSMEDPWTDLDVNCRGNLVLLEALRVVNRDALLVFVGSRLQYGRQARQPVGEDQAPEPLCLHAIHKSTVESYLRL